MKRSIALLLALVMLLGLAACASKTSNDTTSNDTASTTTGNDAAPADDTAADDETPDAATLSTTGISTTQGAMRSSRRPTLPSAPN